MAYTSLFKRDDVRITQAFSSTHKGLDLSRGVVEQPIYLPNKAINGYVWKILPGYYYGGKYYADSPIIYIKHKDGSGSRYLHSYTKNVKVKVGDTIQAGTQVCCTGNSGYSFGDHLHFEWLTKWDDLNTRADPAPYVINDKIVPQPDPCAEVVKGLEAQITSLQEAVATLQAGKQTSDERIKFLEDNLVLREKELKELEDDYARIKGERDSFEKQYLEVVTELNKLKEEKSIIDKFLELLSKLFRGE